ncbi:MAG: transporter substrate-binding domain-containing protein [Candidatus Thiodiazotropha sp. (ex Ustalcina ferruginea)]|nr:transporter substrate-binding domain-containing protein [Candidatus Thiodiazotropha sp. (ex Ustalcina ferruginea)]
MSDITVAVNADDGIATKKSLQIMTEVWLPYINPEMESLGSAARIIDILAAEMETDIDWRYISYAVAYQLIRRDKAELAFPYFLTAKREKEVIFSYPMFSVTSRIYYNRQFYSEGQVKKGFSSLRTGKVDGYSYGESLDQLLEKAEIFATEQAALAALFNHAIDLLPMTEGVMKTTLERYFPNRGQLVLAVPGISGTSSLHVIAPDTPQGKAAIQQLNDAIDQLKALKLAGTQASYAEDKKSVDLAQLIPAEGYPAILGQVSMGTTNNQYFTLPQGTRVVVLEWSTKILTPSNTDRLYKNMMDLSRVVILNGPHVGKELYVRNMHIHLQ